MLVQLYAYTYGKGNIQQVPVLYEVLEKNV